MPAITVTATDPAGNTSEFSQRIIFSIIPLRPRHGRHPASRVSGTDFADPSTITVGGIAATGVTFVNDHSLNAVMPALAPGTSNDVVVTTPDGTTGTLIKGWVADFLDVPGGHQFYSFVTTLVSNGITAGVGGGNYGVDQGTKRQQMAVFLLKAKYGLCYVPPTCTGTFPDVPCPSTFADWIEDLADQGITSGCGGGLFCPNNLVTRRQMAVFLLKTKYGSSYVPPACTGVFDDVACPGAPAVDFIERLAAEQITGGCSVIPPSTARTTPPTAARWRRSSSRPSDCNEQSGPLERFELPPAFGRRSLLPRACLWWSGHRQDVQLAIGDYANARGSSSVLAAALPLGGYDLHRHEHDRFRRGIVEAGPHRRAGLHRTHPLCANPRTAGRTRSPSMYRSGC